MVSARLVVQVRIVFSTRESLENYDVLVRIDRWRRSFIGAAYVLATGAGTGASFAPSPAFHAQGVIPLLYIAWIACLVGGGLSSLVGLVTRLALWELLGLIALSTGFLMFLAVLLGRVSTVTSAIINVCLVGMVLALLCYRYFEVIRLTRQGRP